MTEDVGGAVDTGVAADTGGDVDTGANGGGFEVPSEYAEKGWAGKISSYDDLFKAHDNAQSLLGKRVVPEDGASDEEYAEFYKRMGRPESADEYVFSDIEGLPEGTDLGEVQGMARDVMHDAGLNKHQADKLWKAFMAKEMEVAGKNSDAISENNKALDGRFDEITGELFGDRYDTVKDSIVGTIRESTLEKYRPVVSEMIEKHPEYAAVLMSVTEDMINKVDAVKAKYGGEDSLKSGGQAAGESKNDVLKKLMAAHDESRSAQPFSPDRQRADAEIKELRTKLESFYK